MVKNIFSTLSKYAFRQEENFLTESLVYILSLILERENVIGLSILAKLCGVRFATWLDNASTISITTQYSVDEGRPDIVIQVGPDKVVFIEVKHDSSLGQDQLERYYAHLENSSPQKKQLVLLTRSRHSVLETTLDQEQFHHVCWYEISGWLSEAEYQNETSQFLVQQFLDFLKEKEMSMEKITWEYIEGVPAMVNLANMLGTAITETLPEEKITRTAGWNWIGYYVGEETDLFVGVRYRAPLKVVIENDRGNDPTFQRELSLQKAYFFSLNAGEQLQCLIDFIRSSFNELFQV